MDCQASDQAFIRRSLFALDGRRALGQAEVNAAEDIIQGIRRAEGVEAPPRRGGLDPGRRAFVLATMTSDAFRRRFSDFFMDALRVSRVEVKSQELCYGDPNEAALTDIPRGALAAYVRDNDASASSPPLPGFTMADLLASSIDLDDVSPLYRAHLFAMMARPLKAANVGPLELERARRQDFGAVFEAAYLHRERTCLPCHNSEYSVTSDADPTKSRAWPLSGLFERALFGSSDGRHPINEELEKGTDDLRARSMLRSLGVTEGEGRQAPYGWSGLRCGSFKEPDVDDPLGVDTYFGSIRSTPEAPTRGRRASVWDLERALRRGVDELAAHGLTRLPDDSLADADEALASMVAASIAELVWTEIMGTRLTIATGFPRTEAQRDILAALTERLASSHFSLKSLLLDIVGHPAFNLKSPDEGCGLAAYQMPPIFDPWTSTANDPAERPNSPADGVFAASPRALRRALHTSMEWPPPPEYPSGAEEVFQGAVGYFLKDAEPGFRGLDFQGRLAWEARYAACEPQAGADFITKLAARAKETPGTTLRDVIITLKDRLVSEPWIDDTSEGPALSALLGAPLDTTNLDGVEPLLRAACGALVMSPQVLLGGIQPRDTRVVPALTPEDASYRAACEALAPRLGEAGFTYTVVCKDDSVVVVK